MKDISTFYLPDGTDAIYISVTGAEIELMGDSDIFRAECAGGAFAIETKEGKVTVKRNRRRFSVARPEIRISVPSDMRADIKITADDCNISLHGGTYGTVEINADRSRLDADSVTAGIIYIRGNDLSADISGMETSGPLVCDMKAGSLLIRFGYFPSAEITLKNGNMGLWESNFTNLRIHVSRGNIHLMLPGRREDYTYLVNAKNGISNAESGGNGARNMNVSSSHGNIFIDFSAASGKETDENDDDVAEDFGKKIGA